MASEARSRRLAEFLGLLSFGVSLMLLISLGTYSPTDPAPFFKAGTTGPARNFIGPIGAFLAELLVPQLFGLAALLLPLVLGWVGWSLFWCRPFDAPYTKGAGLLLLLLSTTALLAMAVGTVSYGGEPLRAGGATGELLSGALIGSFNRTGAYILLATGLFVAIILSTQFSFAAALSLAGALIVDRTRAAAAAWVRFREARRKERMRREVIRKHTQKERIRSRWKRACPACARRAWPRTRRTCRPRPRGPCRVPPPRLRPAGHRLHARPERDARAEGAQGRRQRCPGQAGDVCPSRPPPSWTS
jgi:S-DNA-T family DNA segregation ATPase FtsK/SpoIIIE